MPRVTRVLEFDTDEMALRGRIGGLTTAARHDPKVTTAKARQTFLSQFERQVDPDGVLPPEERQRRAEAAKRAHMARLALKSSQARRSRRTA